LDFNRAAQAQLRAKCFVIGNAATDGNRQQTMLAPKVIDGLYTCLTMLGGYFVQTV
jgi:hypothetical protein